MLPGGAYAGDMCWRWKTFSRRGNPSDGDIGICFLYTVVLLDLIHFLFFLKKSLAF